MLAAVEAAVTPMVVMANQNSNTVGPPHHRDGIRIDRTGLVDPEPEPFVKGHNLFDGHGRSPKGAAVNVNRVPTLSADLVIVANSFLA
jgi:hypothetical protein